MHKSDSIASLAPAAIDKTHWSQRLVILGIILFAIALA
jgi:hypothetical protein